MSVSGARKFHKTTRLSGKKQHFQLSPQVVFKCNDGRSQLTPCDEQEETLFAILQMHPQNPGRRPSLSLTKWRIHAANAPDVDELPVEFSKWPSDGCRWLSEKHRSGLQFSFGHMGRIKLGENRGTSMRADKAKGRLRWPYRAQKLAGKRFGAAIIVIS